MFSPSNAVFSTSRHEHVVIASKLRVYFASILKPHDVDDIKSLHFSAMIWLLSARRDVERLHCYAQLSMQ